MIPKRRWIKLTTDRAVSVSNGSALIGGVF
ncbi:hypothetical protein Goshw_024628 [Gossypium schwendimanii]|uniref:Uncharacterized protein n=1 Tax=Gossypium schwendimanii TaxID=34291 RepID=A0A7J9LBM4_GOSSC|nr:hypothetical protein [Gossypium schwendimanii]